MRKRTGRLPKGRKGKSKKTKKKKKWMIVFLIIFIHIIIENNRLQMSKKTQNYLLAKTGLGEVKKGFH